LTPRAWETFDADGAFLGTVTATNALEALDRCPPGTSVYVGGPSDAEPDRPWWADELQTMSPGPNPAAV
jgi:hypothetical protein